MAEQTLTPSASKKKHSKKRKPIDVTVDASSSSSSAASPVVAYFPSGYDPVSSGDAPRARLFRHPRHPSRLELVVATPAGGGGGGGGVEFVGRSYAGEAATPQLCSYSLGVLDKATGTLKVVPIAANKILRLEPHLGVEQPAHTQQSENLTEEGSPVTKVEKKREDLTRIFGAKKDKDKDKKWQSLNQQRDDPSALEDIDLGKSETNVHTIENEAATIVRNIPPYDPAADTPEKAYILDEIIPKSIRPYLLEILEHVDSGEFASKGYGSFVSNRIHKLNKLQDEGKERLAWILSYITHLLSFFARNSSMSKHQRKASNAKHGPPTPSVVYNKLLHMFVDPGSSALSTEKNELLINYILVLTLFADDFKSEPADICTDLKMTRSMLTPYYQQLGCKGVKVAHFQPSIMTLPAPLKFPQERRRRRRW